MVQCTCGDSRHATLLICQVVWISIFQYCFIRPAFTVVSVIAQTQGRYCMSSKDPRYAYIWAAGFNAISVTIAMYCLIQFYVQLKDDLAPHRPFMKVLCIKLVIFFCFWQSWIISLLTAEGGPLKATDQIAGPDLRVGVPSMLTCVEMAVFAVLHLYAFPWNPYDLAKSHEALPQGDHIPRAKPKRYTYGPTRALLDALNPWDIVKAVGRGLRWLFYGSRHRKSDPSYQTKLETMSHESTGYTGPTFAGNGEPAMETASRPGKNKLAGKDGFADSDTSALLSHAQTNPYVHQSSHSNFGLSSFDRPANPDSLPAAPTSGEEHGVAAPESRPYPQHGRYSFESQDTTYHGVTHDSGPRSSSRRTYEVNVGRPVQGHDAQWDMFAGATQMARPPGARPPGGGPPGFI
jgi:hypothetical protein